MKFTKRLAIKQLSLFVKHYWVLEIEPEDLPLKQLYFPYGSFEVIYFLKNRAVMNYVNENEEFEQPEFFYSGQLTKPFYLSFSHPCVVAGISLMPWAGNLLYGANASEFTNHLVKISDLNKYEHLYCEDICNTEKIIHDLEEFIEQKIKIADNDKIATYPCSTNYQQPQ